MTMSSRRHSSTSIFATVLPDDAIDDTFDECGVSIDRIGEASACAKHGLEVFVQNTEFKAPNVEDLPEREFDSLSETAETQKAFSLSDWREVNDLDEIDLEETVTIEEDEEKQELSCREVVDLRYTQVSREHEDKATEQPAIQIDDTQMQTRDDCFVHVNEEVVVDMAIQDSEDTVKQTFLQALHVGEDAEKQCQELERSVNTLVDTFPDTVERVPPTLDREQSLSLAMDEDAFTSEFKRRRLFYLDLERRRCMI
mmetsp:Transcript_25175/g.39398  ORF Transcript_25175/g.39398 Transcript_25175/m.39398 type:complete len:255 (-) Transcript_25175:52-816(-)